MAKKLKNDTKVYKEKEGRERVEEIMQNSDQKSLYLPKSISIKDIDDHFFQMIDNGVLKLSLDGYKDRTDVPTIFMTNERWGEFSKTWKYVDIDKNLPPPYITVRRETIEPGTYIGVKYNIPNNKTFSYIKVPTFKDRIQGYDIYKIPQPTAIDITYDVRLFTKYLVDVNDFYSLYLKNYASRQLYLNVNGHYFTTLLDDNFDNEDSVEDIDGDKYLVKIFNITVKGYLIDERDFIKIEAINRIVKTTEISNQIISRDTYKTKL